jgi:plastocyanin
MSSSYLSGLMALTMAAVCCSARAETIPVTIKGLVFLPAQTHAKVGDTIEWINQDFVVHTATARNGDWDVVIAAHKSARQILTKAGTIEYYCRFHPNMKATVTIVPE